MRIAINGFGRVGRNIARALLGTENQVYADLELAALNDLAPIAHSTHLLKYDSVYGQFQKPISIERNRILIGDDRIEYLSEADPSKANWGDLNIDLVLECTGCFPSAEKSSAHLEAGAKRVLISQPASIRRSYSVSIMKLSRIAT